MSDQEIERELAAQDLANKEAAFESAEFGFFAETGLTVCVLKTDKGTVLLGAGQDEAAAKANAIESVKVENPSYSTGSATEVNDRH